MDGRHRETLEAIFAEPEPAIDWEDVEDLMILIGCSVVRENDERVTFELDGLIGSFNRPPALTSTRRHVVLAVREFLMKVGVMP